MAVLRLFAAAREAAGSSVVEVEAATVGDVLAVAVVQFGDHFANVLEHSRVWLNGQPTTAAEPVAPTDVVAVLPPVSGGADDDKRVLASQTRDMRGSGESKPEVEGSAARAIAPAVPAMEPYRRVL